MGTSEKLRKAAKQHLKIKRYLDIQLMYFMDILDMIELNRNYKFLKR